jgi:glycosyltransferase involved in cell wall biosynthesis
VVTLRILFLSPGLAEEFADYKNDNLLGVETQINGLARELAKLGYEIYVIRRWLRDSLKTEQIDGIHLVNVASPIIPSFAGHLDVSRLIYSKYARDEARKIGPSILILPDTVSSFFFRDLKMPKIYVTHNPQSDMMGGHYFRRACRIKAEKRLFDACDIIVTLNSSTQHYFQSKGYNVSLIPNGVNEKNFRPKSDDGYVLNSGRQVPHKHLDLLIDAYAMLPSSLQEDYKLILAGQGPEHERLKRMSQRLAIENRVQFVPRLAKDEYIDTMSKCSTFVLPTTLEGFGTVTIEAMACAKPVIVSDIAAPRDIISQNHNGFLFKNQNANDLARCLELCLSDTDLRRKIGFNARKTIEQKYSFRRLAEKYTCLFDQIGA